MKDFFAGLLRFLIANIVCAIIACILTMVVVDLIAIELIGVKIRTCVPYFVAGGIIGGVSGLGLCGLFCVKFKGACDVVFGDPDLDTHPKLPYLFITIIAGALILGAVLVMVLCQNKFNFMMILNEDWTILYTVFGSIVGGTFAFWVFVRAHFKKDLD